MNHSKSGKIRSSTVLVGEAFERMFDQYRHYILTIVVAIVACSLFFGLYSLLVYVTVNYMIRTDILFAKAVSIRLIFISLAYLILLVIFSYVNGLFIAATRFHVSFRANCRKIWKILPRLIGLHIILGLVGFLATSPLYGIALTVFAKMPYQNFTAAILLILLFIFLCLAAVWFSTTAFLMVDQNLKISEAVKKNFQLVRGHEMVLLGRLVILVALLAMFQFVALTLSVVPGLNILGTLLILFIVTPFIYSYLNEVYSDLK